MKPRGRSWAGTEGDDGTTIRAALIVPSPFLARDNTSSRIVVARSHSHLYLPPLRGVRAMETEDTWLLALLNRDGSELLVGAARATASPRGEAVDRIRDE